MIIKKVCTIGPASSSPQMIQALLQAGMSVARINFSHGTHESLGRIIDDLRKVISEDPEHSCSIMQDLSGPKLRIYDPVGELIRIKTGETIKFQTTGKKAAGTGLSLTRQVDLEDLEPGQKIIIGDGNACFEMISRDDSSFEARALNDCEISGSKGISFPGARLSRLKAITEIDRKDIEFGLRKGIDLIAVSFVGSGEDIREVRSILKKEGREDLPVIAKIERSEAVGNIDEILMEADGIMVARGDLGLDTELSEVPFLQKKLILKAIEAAKPVITATQMLESMITNPTPTRAEVNDIANSILDGTDALMLSGETAIGRYPLESLRYMNSVVEKGKDYYPYWRGIKERENRTGALDIEETIGLTVCEAARAVKAQAIVALTRTGQTARLIARYRPEQTIYAITPNQNTINLLNLVAGCEPLLHEEFQDYEKLVKSVVDGLKARRKLNPEDIIVISGGTPLGKKGTTNFLKILRA